jgi:uroporphyrinogen decarboxylase
MKGKERVINAINHLQSDRVPMDIWAEQVVWETLRNHYRVPTDEEVRERLDVDIRNINPPSLYEKSLPDENGIWHNEWGVGLKHIKHDTGYYDDVVYHPLARAETVEDVEKYPWPDPAEYDFSVVEKECQRFGDKALVGGYGHFFCPGADLRGYEQWLIDIIECSPVGQAIMEHMEAYWTEYSNRVLDASKGLLDIFYLADDYSSQRGLIMSPRSWEAFFRPPIERMIRIGKSRGLKILFHSCGSVRKLIPRLIDIGVDILNPIQIRAADMDPAELVREFGKDLSFHGGVDLQQTLPFGTPEEVREEVLMLIDTLGGNNGYILAPGHTIQPDAPIENILAMYETAVNLR